MGENYEDLEKDVLKKSKRREKKKKPQMKVSGKSIFKLAEVIRKRSKK